ncbi:MAG: Na+:solute symporter [Oligoflexia bacterium]|nr:Na+:solute symporter [Oligoflexia bacterium]
MTLIDALIIFVFIGYSIYSGLKNKEIASKNLVEYFLAGRSLKGWQAGISMAATQFAADTPLLVTGLIATAGIFSLWRLWIYAFSFLLLGFLLAPCWRRSEVLTDAELVELRYDQKLVGTLRGIKAIYFGTIFNCTVLAMVLLAATRLAEPFLHWQEWLSPWFFNFVVSLVKSLNLKMTLTQLPQDQIWIVSASNFISIGAIVLMTVFYSTAGGLRSVVNTDTLQFFIAIIASIIFAYYVVDKAGGLDSIKNLIMKRFSQPNSWGIVGSEILAFTPSRAKDVSFVVLAVFAFQWLVQMNSDGTGYLAQRVMACKSDQDAKTATVIFTFAQIIVRSLIWIPLGLGLLVVFPPDPSLSGSLLTADREFTYVKGISEILPPGIKGLVLVGMLAALASTIDTHLNWGASYWTNDIYKRFICKHIFKKEPSSKSLVRVARLANILILVIALSLVPVLDSVQTAWQISLILGAGMGVVLLLRWLWWRINALSEIFAIGISALLAPFLIIVFPGLSDAAKLIIVAICSTLAAVIASFFTTPTSQKHLVQFYKKVNPPGYWGKIAELAGADPSLAVNKFWKSIGITFLATFSFFCLLTAFGTLLAGSPEPKWFPSRMLWISTLLALGFGLWPVWYQFSKESHSKAG